ncbi:hypothetical protein GOP47_0021257 [Adiantum capillus-veneris]|uniref:HTH myb-type domain-containing protein n=1 Tax=Adiantum capillus-veneris TaxID=13818 RepID=A0A9D4UBJ5_ADICA|nr:hypothetical protein GOP47_0021257 [Adiantum capillus-veneris]
MTMNLNCMSEWDRCLPRPDELTPLSQGLIPHDLACAFNIPPSSSASTCTVTTPSSDVLNTSPHSAFESFLRMRSVLLPSIESEQKGVAETAVPLYQSNFNEPRDVMKPVKETSDQSLDGMQLNQAGRVGGVLMAGAYSSSAPDNDYGSVLGPGMTNGLSRLMSNSSYAHITESSVVDVNHPKALLEEARGGCGRTTGSMLEGTNFMHLKVDPSEEVDSAPSSMDTFQGNSVAISNEEQSARTLKKPRLVWTPQLHKRFVDAVAHLGIKHAVPKTIMQLMNVDGLTRENVASHLQKYRLYLKRMQGLSNEGPSSSDHLFASTPVPPSLAASAHFLVSHHSQHLDHPYGPVQNSNLPAILGHTAHHLAPHISSQAPSFSSFNTRPAFSSLTRAPAPPLMSSDLMREGHMQQSSSAPGQVLTLFPTSHN